VKELASSIRYLKIMAAQDDNDIGLFQLHPQLVVIPERLCELSVGLVIHVPILPSRGRMVVMIAVSVRDYEAIQKLLDG
jgi:hypothetical protein